MVTNFCVFRKSRAIHENSNLEIFTIHVQVNCEPCFNLSYIHVLGTIYIAANRNASASVPLMAIAEAIQ